MVLEISPTTLIFSRASLGTILLLCLLAARGQPAFPPRDAWSSLALMGFVGVAVHQLLQAVGLTMTTAVNTGWLIGLTPIWSALLAAWTLKERLGPTKLAGLATGFAGALLVMTRGRLEPSILSLPATRGDLLILASSLNWAIYSVLGHPTIRRLGPTRATAGAMFVGWLMLAPFFVASSGWRDYARLPEKAATAVLFLVHGLAEHSGRYRNPADYFVPRGWACHALDYRGHGKSPGRSVHVPSFDEYVTDVRTVHDVVRARHPELPVFVVGHSHGGLILLRYALGSLAGTPGLVVNSPLLAIHPSARPSALKAWAARIFVHVAPGLLQPSTVDPAGVSRDPAVVEAYRNDPLVSRRLSLGWYRALLEAQADVMTRAAELRVPTLLMASGADRLVDVDVTRRFVSRAPAALVAYVEWKGLYHESFNEPEKDQVFGRMETWLNARLAQSEVKKRR